MIVCVGGKQTVLFSRICGLWGKGVVLNTGGAGSRSCLESGYVAKRFRAVLAVVCLLSNFLEGTGDKTKVQV